MMLVFFRGAATPTLISALNARCHLGILRFCSNKPPFNGIDDEIAKSTLDDTRDISFRNHREGIHDLSPLFWRNQPHLESNEITVVDSDTWRISSGLAHVLKDTDHGSPTTTFGVEEVGDQVVGNPVSIEDEPDLDDEIENLRIRGNLFYKIDRSSREFEEYKFDFHRRKSKKNESNSRMVSKNQKPSKGDEDRREGNKKERIIDNSSINKERFARTLKEKYIVCTSHNDTDNGVGKKQRKPTFNQLTGPYHEPFCLDIYISKGSVRACIVHRVTSKVVAVAHSISKDMKFDLGSKKNASTCAAVGEILALRALDDDIHDVIYTPRKGEKIEGKLQIALQSIMDNGLNVQVKLKQRNHKKSSRLAVIKEH